MPEQEPENNPFGAYTNPGFQPVTSVSEEPVSQQPATTETVTTESQPEIIPEGGQPNAATATQTAATEQPVITLEATTAEIAAPITDDDVIKELFGGATDSLNPSTPAASLAVPVDFSAYKEVLGKEIKTNDEFISEIKALKEAQSQYDKVLTGLPLEAKNLILETARSGGDWKKELNYVSFDFNSIPAVEYYKDDLITSGQFPNTPEGLQERDEWLEAQDARLVNALAQPLKNKAVADQQQYIYQQQQRIVTEKAEKDAQLRQTLYGEKAIKSIGGVLVTPAKADSYYQRLSQGEVVYKGKDGRPDFDQAVQMLHFYENRVEIAKTLMNRARASGVKEVLLNSSNVNVTKNAPPTQYAAQVAEESGWEAWAKTPRR